MGTVTKAFRRGGHPWSTSRRFYRPAPRRGDQRERIPNLVFAHVSDEQGPDGPRGPDIVRSVCVAAAMFLEAVLQCMRALAASIAIASTHYVPDCLARAAMEAGSQAFWPLESGIGVRRRVARFMLIRAADAMVQSRSGWANVLDRSSVYDAERC